MDLDPLAKWDAAEIKALEQYRDQPGDQWCPPFVWEDDNVKYPFL